MNWYASYVRNGFWDKAVDLHALLWLVVVVVVGIGAKCEARQTIENIN